MHIKIKILQHHIEQGRICAAMMCPFALALMELGYQLAYVTYTSIICLKEDRTMIAFRVTKEARQWIHDFDNEIGGSEPAEFELEEIRVTQSLKVDMAQHITQSAKETLKYAAIATNAAQ